MLFLDFLTSLSEISLRETHIYIYMEWKTHIYICIDIYTKNTCSKYSEYRERLDRGHNRHNMRMRVVKRQKNACSTEAKECGQ
jgi:hypothetical protein